MSIDPIGVGRRSGSVIARRVSVEKGITLVVNRLDRKNWNVQHLRITIVHDERNRRGHSHEKQSHNQTPV